MITRSSHIAVFSVLALSACNALPDSGPTEAAIVHHAKDPKRNPLAFKIVDIDPRVISILASQPEPVLSTLDRVEGSPLTANRIGPGDVLSVSVLELGSGLFAGTSSSGVGSAPLSVAGPNASVTTAQLPQLTVDEDGRVAVPYVGEINANGLTPEQLARAIQAGLHGKSQNPQVVVRVSTDLSNAIIIYGDLHKPGRIPLTLAHERLLDAIALAGGPESSPEDTEVRVTRHGFTGGIPLRALEESPSENILMRPGDRVEVLLRPRTYTVFGATSKVSEVTFNVANLSLADALARIGGPLDERADPNAVFIFRFEDANAARRLGLAIHPALATTPIAYRLDMLDPTDYFLAQRFAMKNQDLIYIANAQTDRLYKFMSIINLLSGPVISGVVLGNTY